MRRALPHGFVLSVAVIVAACAPIRVTTYPGEGRDLTRHRVYQWSTTEVRPTGDPRLDSNPFFENHLKGAVDRQLLRKGYVDTATAGVPADFSIRYYAAVYQRLDIDEPSPCTGANCRTSVIELDEGTIVVDAIDARTATLMWRGIARDSVQGIVNNQSRMEREIDRVIARLFAQFPPRTEGSN